VCVGIDTPQDYEHFLARCRECGVINVGNKGP
jgi:hypothetical protein